MRAFLALDLDAPAREAWAAIREDLTRRLSRFRWVRPEHLHLTRRFLGEVPEELVAELEPRVAEVGARHPLGALVLGGAGTFGPARAPRVVWLAVEGDDEGLAGLQRDLERTVREAGIPRESRPWNAHVTLARARGRKPASGLDEEGWEALERLRGLQLATREIVCFASELGSEGPVHTPFWKVPLGDRET